MRGATLRAVLQDFSEFDVPAGLSEDAWRAVIAQQLLERPFIESVFEYCQVQRRFGDVAGWIRSMGYCPDTSRAAKELWQTTVRWLEFFVPESILNTIRKRSYVSPYSSFYFLRTIYNLIKRTEKVNPSRYDPESPK